MKNLEIEIRSKLSNEGYFQLETFLNQKAIKVKEFNRLTVKFVENGPRLDTVDLKVRIEDTKAEIIGKFGNQSSNTREEISVGINIDNFKDSLALFNKLGYSKGVAFWRKTKVFEFNKVEISLVEVPNYTKYVEFEIISNESEKNAAIEKINSVISSLNLKGLSEEENYKFIEELDLNSNLEYKFNVKILDKLLDPTSEIWKKYKVQKRDSLKE